MNDLIREILTVAEEKDRQDWNHQFNRANAVGKARSVSSRDARYSTDVAGRKT
jgi:hypothetical protein